MRKAVDLVIYILYLAFFIWSLSAAASGGDTLYIEADGREYAFSLSEDGIHEVEGAIGTTVIEIRDSEARIISSPCPNQTCVRSGWSGTLCCLPNRVICTAGRGEGGVDAISG